MWELFIIITYLLNVEIKYFLKAPLEIFSTTITLFSWVSLTVLDENHYETGKKVTEEQIKQINIEGDEFHPEWNYIIKPRN
ncbi:MAG TPA: hypothetical protein VMR41_03315 [Patescibacteria group bacterium]|nr:hypothetical protein [Patescibacteria group bacterium]